MRDRKADMAECPDMKAGQETVRKGNKERWQRYVGCRLVETETRNKAGGRKGRAR